MIPAMQYELGIIGAGNMAEAIARGVIRGGVFAASQMLAADVAPVRRDLFSHQLGIQTTPDNAEVARRSRRLLLSVKPHQMADVLGPIGSVLDPGALVISIAAGISTAAIEKALGDDRPRRVIRAMPNTPMMVGDGVVAIARGRHATADDAGLATRIFATAASVAEVDESLMDAVTALSGSGPAYFYYLVEHMIAAGVEMGLTPEQADAMAKKTALGAARLLIDSTDTPAELRRKVTTPGGTTAAALDTFEKANMGKTIVAALKAAADRGREMGRTK